MSPSAFKKPKKNCQHCNLPIDANTYADGVHYIDYKTLAEERRTKVQYLTSFFHEACFHHMVGEKFYLDIKKFFTQKEKNFNNCFCCAKQVHGTKDEKNVIQFGIAVQSALLSGDITYLVGPKLCLECYGDATDFAFMDKEYALYLIEKEKELVIFKKKSVKANEV